MTEAKDNFGDCSEKSLFLSVLTKQSFETPWQRHCRVKRRKQEVKQAPEKPRKELEIMEDISKPSQSTASSNDLFGMIVAEKIKNLSSKKKRKIKFEINIFLFSNTRKAMMLQHFHNRLRFRHQLQSKRMAI